MTAVNSTTVAYLGLGSNLGDRLSALRAAVATLSAQCGVTVDPLQDVASLYESKAVGGPVGQPDYLNTVLRVRTSMTPVELLRVCLGVESELGRVRQERWGPRTIDIDLLLFGDRAIDDTDLAVPHPRMQDRPFVLMPLRELAPDLIHPTLSATVGELVERCCGDDGLTCIRQRDWVSRAARPVGGKEGATTDG